jgi:hypothetical protein
MGTLLSERAIFEAHDFSGITGGPSARGGAGNRPTIGLSEIGSVARGLRRGAGGNLAS